MKDYGLIEKPRSTGLFSGMRNSIAPYILAALPLVYSCGGSGGSPGGPSNPSPIANPGGKVTVIGQIKDRIDDSSINGSTIEFRGVSAQSDVSGASALATIVNGTYEIKDLVSGSYEVTINGPNHVSPRKTMRVDVSPASNRHDFYVNEWNSGRDGATYDSSFDEFYNQIARNSEWSNSRVKKWTTMPTEILVDQNTYNMLSPRAQEEFMSLLNEVNYENIPAMFCGKVGPLPINIAPYDQRTKNGSLLIKFQNEQSGAPRMVSGDSIVAATALLNVNTHGNLSIPRQQRKNNLSHELFHDAGMDHAYGFGNRDGLMNGNNFVGNLSAQDRLAACIVYHDDTKPGNRGPDVNMQ